MPGHRSVGECAQADLDAWFAQDATARRVVRAFLRWSTDHQVMPRLKVPTIRTERPAPISRHHRIAPIRKIMNGDDLPLSERIAAALILLHAQPVRRFVRPYSPWTPPPWASDRPPRQAGREALRTR
ncbi:hypothetical protein [Streptomyces sp. NPDC050263]|uniref:hypothetical protein n=1 Tax=Streptomyces sp. NPDC050263 TaxID=3155037 RepID=UPI003447E840